MNGRYMYIVGLIQLELLGNSCENWPTCAKKNMLHTAENVNKKTVSDFEVTTDFFPYETNY